MAVSGKYYDGKTSRTIEAVFSSDADRQTRVARWVIRTKDGTEIVSADLDRIRISPRLANTPRYLYFPGGEKFETLDHTAVDGLQDRLGHGSRRNLVHFLETRMRYVLVSLALLLLFMWAGVRYGVPAASELLARHLPQTAVEYAGSRTLDILDKSVFKPSKLGEARQNSLLEHFQPALDAHRDLKVIILFRKGGPIGPNAFALPNGRIIFTDEMVDTAKNDDELLAVLFHEIGHLTHCHGMRTVIQDSLLGVALLTLTGDVTGSAELFMGLPLFLTQMAYSRGFELEADQYALERLSQAGILPAHFANLMERIETRVAAKNKNSDQKWWSYLSTHPGMDKRLKPFRE